jgi:signal transduction protein with GAF and PtsI domain
MALFLDHIRLRSQNQRQTQVKAQAASAPSTATAKELEELLAAVMSAEEEVVRQNKDLGILNTLSHEVGAVLQLNVILEAAVKRTRLALNVEVGWFYTFEEGMLVLREHQGLSEQYVQELRHLKPGDGAEGMAFNRRQPILRDALLFHSGRARAVVDAEGLRAVAAIPLLSPAGDSALGVLAVGDRSARQWSMQDQRLLMLISRQVAQAVTLKSSPRPKRKQPFGKPNTVPFKKVMPIWPSAPKFWSKSFKPCAGWSSKFGLLWLPLSKPAVIEGTIILLTETITSSRSLKGRWIP